MLYKVWESQTFQYVAEETIVDQWGGWGTWYGIWTTNRPEEFTMQDGTSTTSLSQVYSFTASWISGWPRSRIDKWDGATGQNIWTHYRSYDLISFRWVSREKIFNDDENKVWSHDIWGFSGGHLYRHPEFTDPNGVMSRGIGMPNFDIYDLLLNDGQWLNEDGTDFAFLFDIGPVVNTLGLSNRGDWAAMTYWGSDGRQLAIHNISDRQRRGYVQLISTAARGLAIDSETLYIFTERLTIEVIDVPRLQHLGELQFGDYAMPSLFQGHLGLGYDRTYRRMITMMPTPDDPVTGACTVKLEGWALREVGERLTKPIVLQTPREGRAVAVLGRLYGWTGKGVSGEQVTGTLLTGDGALNPTRTSADAGGFVKFMWTPASPDDATCDIQLSASVTQTEPDLTPPDYQAPLSQPPSVIVAEGRQEFFHPGFWLYAPTATRVRESTAEQALGPYYDDYSWIDPVTGEIETRDNRWRGALVEYSWYELETLADTYNLAKITADLNWAKANHLKLMICIRTTPEVADGTAWIPNYIVNDETGLYPASTTCAGKRGVFAPQFSDPLMRVCMPMLTDEVVRARFQTLITTILTEYLTDDDFVGIFPLDYPCAGSGAWSSAGVQLSAWYEARREILLQARASIKLINEWIIPRKPGCTYDPYHPLECIYFDATACNYYDAAHKSWCVTNGVGIVSPKYHLDNYLSTTTNAGNAIAAAGSMVATGWALGAETWGTTHNLDCTSSQASFWELVFGGADLLNNDTGCNKKPLNSYVPWYLFVEPTAEIWDVSATSSMTTMDHKVLIKEAGYYGVVASPTSAEPTEFGPPPPSPENPDEIFGQGAGGTWYTLGQEMGGEVTEALFVPSLANYHTAIFSNPGSDRESYWGCGPATAPGVDTIFQCDFDASLRGNVTYMMRLPITDGFVPYSVVRASTEVMLDGLGSYIFALSKRPDIQLELDNPEDVDELCRSDTPDTNRSFYQPRWVEGFYIPGCSCLDPSNAKLPFDQLYIKWKAVGPNASRCGNGLRCAMYIVGW